MDVIAHNTAHGTGDGFYDDYGASQQWLNNTANGLGGYGFYLDCDEDGPTTVIGNTANGNGGIGFDDYYSVGATFSGNIAKNNSDDGFYFDYPGDIKINGTIARGNADSGIELADNYGVGYGVPKSISNNTVKGNNYGLYAGYGVPNGVCVGNVITNNTTANVTGANCT
jgi:parallel beta-helix repeat protein